MAQLCNRLPRGCDASQHSIFSNYLPYQDEQGQRPQYNHGCMVLSSFIIIGYTTSKCISNHNPQTWNWINQQTLKESPPLCFFTRPRHFKQTNKRCNNKHNNKHNNKNNNENKKTGIFGLAGASGLKAWLGRRDRKFSKLVGTGQK